MLDICVGTNEHLHLVDEWYARILRYTTIPYTIYVSDNSKSDDVWNLLAVEPTVSLEKFPFKCLANSWNRAIKRGSNPYVLVANIDAFCTEGWESYISVMKEKDIKLLTPIESVYCNQKILPMFKDYPQMTLDNCDALAKEHKEKHKGDLEIYKKDEYIYKNQTVTERLPPTGCWMLFERKALEEVGYFDEQYQWFCEDVDMYYTMNKKYNIAVAGDWLLYHMKNYYYGRMGLGDPMSEGRVKFYAKWQPYIDKVLNENR